MLSRKSKLVTLIFSVLFLTVLNHAIDNNAEALHQVLQLIAYASLLIAGGLIAVSFCSLLGTFVRVENLAMSRLLIRASEDPVRNFFIGFLMTAYLNLVRPPLTTNLLFLPYMEWVVISLAVYAMYTMTRLSTKEFYGSSEGLGWKRHIQEVKRETGRDLVHVTAVMEQFVDHGVKEPLLVYLALHLQRLRETEEGILNTLSPLIDYQKNAGRHKLYFLVFPWTKRKFAMRNKEAREVLLKTLLEKIDGLRSE
jgi:hypothetical protein